MGLAGGMIRDAVQQQANPAFKDRVPQLQLWLKTPPRTV
jgi:hypothetical protein